MCLQAGGGGAVAASAECVVLAGDDAGGALGPDSFSDVVSWIEVRAGTV